MLCRSPHCLLVLLAAANAINIPTLSLETDWYTCDLNTTTFNESGAQLHGVHVKASWRSYMSDQYDGPLPSYAECTKLIAPLCYEGICNSSKTIQLFVKRIRALSSAGKAILIMDGGPGAASCDMEDLQQRTWKAMNGEMDVYIHDPRGTGRSEMLKCTSDANKDLPACLDQLNKRYGDNAAGFGITSAATDLVALTKTINTKQEWYLYGVSYGTLLAARAMHVGNAFKGYIFDSVTPENWDDTDIGFNDVAQRYLMACENDKFCFSQVKKPLAPQVAAIYKSYDNMKDTSSQLQRCRDWLRVQMSLRSEEPTSFGVKKLFAWFIRSVSKQRLFPPLLLRLSRCNDEDWGILNGAFTKFLDLDELEDNILFPYDSRQLNQMIEASEIMEVETYDELIEEFKANLITLPGYDALIPFCYYHNSTFEECEILNLPPVQPFIYQRDNYFGKYATIPDDASVLVLTGAYDPITPSGWAQAEFDGLNGENKALYILDNIGHSVVDTPCGFSLYKQFLQANGDLDQIDSACIATIPTLPFKIPMDLSKYVFGVDDIYAGL